MDKEVYTVKEVAEMLGLGRNTVYDNIRTGKIPHVQLGKRILIPKGPVDRFLNTKEELTITSGQKRAKVLRDFSWAWDNKTKRIIE